MQCAEHLGLKINPLSYRVTVRRDDGNFLTVSLPFSDGESCIVQPAPSLPHGFSNVCNIRASYNEGFSTLGCITTTVPWQSPWPEGKNIIFLHYRSPSVEGRTSSCVMSPGLSRITITMDASLSGCGATMMGRAVNGIQSLRQCLCT